MMREERYNPYKPLTREKIKERLVISRKHAEEGKVMPAHQVSANIRKKYGLYSTAPAYVFVKVEMATAGLYEVVGTESASIDGWCRVTSAESEGEIILAYGELGNMTPVSIGETVSLDGRLHCLSDAVQYSSLTGTDMDIDVHGCLVYGTDNDGGEAVYNKSAESLWQAYQDNKDQ